MKWMKLIVVMILTTSSFAWLPNTTKSVLVDQHSNLRSITERVESVSACTVYLEMTSTLQGVAPAYLQIVSRGVTGRPHQGYTLTLKDETTGEYVFSNVKTTTGAVASKRIKTSAFNFSDRYILTIHCPPSIKKKGFLGLGIIGAGYDPPVTIYYGAFQSNLQFDVEF